MNQSWTGPGKPPSVPGRPRVIYEEAPDDERSGCARWVALIERPLSVFIRTRRRKDAS